MPHTYTAEWACYYRGMKQMPQLDVYVSADCWSCKESMRIVSDMREQFPNVAIELVDIDPDTWPQEVFAVPTYMLDGRVISLGNPTRERLTQQLTHAQSM